MAHTISPMSSNVPEAYYKSLPFTYTNVSGGSSFQPEGKSPRRPLSKEPTMLWKRAQRAWHHSWGAESYGILLAASSLAAIVSVSAVFDGKAVPEWPLKISINALIAVLTVLMKAGLGILFAEGISQLKWQWFQEESRRLMDLDDFDNASRGAVGSISFLFKVRRWESTNTFAKFAAILTILAAIVDPFSQQIFGVVDCKKVSNQLTASIARANEYYANGGHTGALEAQLDSPMAVAINTGLVNPPNHIPSLVSTTCESGNCTFESFSSIAVCHSCTDISSQIENNTLSFYNYSLPADSNSKYSTLRLSTSLLLTTSASTEFGLLSLRILSRKGDFRSRLSMESPNAFQCQLFPCVRTYANVSVKSSALEETVVSKTAMGFSASGNFDYILVPSNYTYTGTVHDKNGDQVRMNCNSPHASNDTTGLTFVPTANVDSGLSKPTSSGTEAPGVWYPSQCRFAFGEMAYLAMRPTLQSYLGKATLEDVEYSLVGDIVARNLWQNATISLDTVNVYMRNLSDVMTAQMRNNGAKGATDYATGIVVVGETCVEIRWAWLSFPAALVGLAFVFMLVLFVQRPRDWPALRSWKSSNLAVLFCNLDESVRQRTDLDWYRDDIDKVARSSSAWLVQDGAGKARFMTENDI